jgi:CRISPR/Cas system-associated exonuclease Cas4 (RecB family)
MLQFWLIDFLSRLKSQMDSKTLAEAFNALKPRTEEYLKSEIHGVHGYVDAIHEMDGFVKIIDYKTSKKDYIDEAYKLQLAIYALLYHEKYGKVPDLVGIHFLKFCEKTLKVDQKLLDFAACECRTIHEKNKSTDMADYPKSISPLCSWSRGCCDFYVECKK